MRIDEIRPGLWRWTTFHTEWRQDVGSVAYEGDDALVLIDPLLEADDALDDLLGRVGKQPVVLVTVFWHTRSADLVARRHGARVLAPAGGKAAVRRRAPTMEAFRPGDPLPGGVEAFPTARASEVVYWALRAPRPRAGRRPARRGRRRRPDVPAELAPREQDPRPTWRRRCARCSTCGSRASSSRTGSPCFAAGTPRSGARSANAPASPGTLDLGGPPKEGARGETMGSPRQAPSAA